MVHWNCAKTPFVIDEQSRAHTNMKSHYFTCFSLRLLLLLFSLVSFLCSMIWSVGLAMACCSVSFDYFLVDVIGQTVSLWIGSNCFRICCRWIFQWMIRTIGKMPSAYHLVFGRVRACHPAVTSQHIKCPFVYNGENSRTWRFYFSIGSAFRCFLPCFFGSLPFHRILRSFNVCFGFGLSNPNRWHVCCT